MDSLQLNWIFFLKAEFLKTEPDKGPGLYVIFFVMFKSRKKPTVSPSEYRNIHACCVINNYNYHYLFKLTNSQLIIDKYLRFFCFLRAHQGTSLSSHTVTSQWSHKLHKSSSPNQKYFINSSGIIKKFSSLYMQWQIRIRFVKFGKDHQTPPPSSSPLTPVLHATSTHF